MKKQYNNKKPKNPGTWDFTDTQNISNVRITTYSVAIFQWIEKDNKKGTKRGTVQFRIIDLMVSDLAIKLAKKLCNRLNNGEDPKSVFNGKKSRSLINKAFKSFYL